MRKIDNIIVHCSATKPSMDIGVEEIRRWHVQDNHWDDIGYHFVIRTNGKVEVGRPLHLIGAHCKGHNSRSIGICYVGGLHEVSGKPYNTLNSIQRRALLALIDLLRINFGISKEQVFTHNYFDSGKACPCFSQEELQMMLPRFPPILP